VVASAAINGCCAIKDQIIAGIIEFEPALIKFYADRADLVSLCIYDLW
jgi:hypothetical protein